MQESLAARLRGRLKPIGGLDLSPLGHAAVMLLITNQEDPHIWLIQRSLSMMLHPGQMAFPGGKGERDDRDLLETALRESEEEVALPRDQAEVCGALNIRYTITGYTVSPFVAVLPATLALSPAPDEVRTLTKLPLAAFADARHLYVDRFHRNGRLRNVPRFEVSGYTVWGMTASMIVELVNRFYDAGFPDELHLPSKPGAQS